MKPHFELQITRSDGSLRGDAPIIVTTAEGVYMNCPVNMTRADVMHLCEVARQTPDYPIDLTAWTGDRLTWSARLYWRENSNERTTGNGSKRYSDI